MIELFELLHQARADLLCRQLAIRSILKLSLDAIGNRFELLHANRPLLARAQQAGNQLLTLKRLAIAVFLDDTILDLFYPLAAGEPLSAPKTLASTTNDVAFAALTRIDDLVPRSEERR